MAWVHVTDYRLHDADSRLYGAMTGELSARPWRFWSAVSWNGHWGHPGLFYEHPPGHLWLGAALVRLGLQPLQALYTINFACLFMSLGLLWRVAYRFGGVTVGRAALWLWALTPAFMQYLVRGNQEHPLGFCLVLATFALTTVASPWRAGSLFAVALTLAMAIKGVAALALLPVGVGCLALRPAEQPDQRHRRWAAAMLAVLASLGAAWAFELWAQAITGESFWGHYVAGQVRHSVGSGGALAKVKNLGYYLGRCLWFGLPPVLLLVTALWRRRSHIKPALNNKALCLGLWVAAVFIGGYAMANRKADRYLFPMYPAMALAAASLVPTFPRLVQLLHKHRVALAYGLPALLALGVVLKVYLGQHHHLDIRWWRSVG